MITVSAHDLARKLAEKYHLLSEKADNPRPGSDDMPSFSYVVCSTPRSGSTLLCEALCSAGGFGVPAEYWEPDSMFSLAVRWGCRTFPEYVAKLYELRTGDNGVFGSKIHWGHLLLLQERVLGKDRISDVELEAAKVMLESFFPGLRYVYITRRNKLRQAVSHFVALQTRRWWDHGDGAELGPRSEPAYSYDAITDVLTRDVKADQSWRGFFVANGIEPITVEYEELAEDYESSVRGTIDKLGFDGSAANVAPPQLRKQSSSLKNDYVERYLRDTARRFVGDSELRTYLPIFESELAQLS